MKQGRNVAGRGNATKIARTEEHKKKRREKWERNRKRWRDDNEYQARQLHRRKLMDEETRKYREDASYRSHKQAEKRVPCLGHPGY